YSSVNTRAQKKIVFVREKCYTILPALMIDGIIALDIIEGSCDRKRFVDFILDQISYEAFAF
ncbi:34034_t:CDS:2, partial [Racocetra persica]